jgi:hypothetical protein
VYECAARLRLVHKEHFRSPIVKQTAVHSLAPLSSVVCLAQVNVDCVVYDPQTVVRIVAIVSHCYLVLVAPPGGNVHVRPRAAAI